MMRSMRRPSSERTGVTLVELLVALTVIAVLLAIALPAIQQAREASRKTECRNHLRQITIACDAFESIRGHYPSSRLFGEHGVGPDSTAWSFLTELLPYVEQGNL